MTIHQSEYQSEVAFLYISRPDLKFAHIVFAVFATLLMIINVFYPGFAVCFVKILVLSLIALSSGTDTVDANVF